jgi:SOS response regulatory protein OraA/RecX
MPVVTALRERPRGRVEVDLDGALWRLVPADAVVRAGLAVGRVLDRETARTLGRELRRSEAIAVAVRALRYGDQSRSRLEARLAGRGASTETRRAALASLEQAGLVDDARLAANRAQSLARRGFGDAAICYRLGREGLSRDLVADAVSELEPEVERARLLLGDRSPTPQALRRLVAKGFDSSTVEAVGGFADEG